MAPTSSRYKHGLSICSAVAALHHFASMIARTHATLRGRSQPHSLGAETETAPIQPRPGQPHPKPRRRAMLKWAALTSTVLTATAWAVSLFWLIDYEGDSRAYELGQGAIIVHCYPRGSGAGWTLGRLTALNPWWYPEYVAGPGWKRYVLPLWIPLLLAAIPTTWAWWRKRRYPVGHCQGCGYDLTGNVTGICSECGEATARFGQDIIR